MHFIINMIHDLVPCTCVGQKHQLLLATFCPNYFSFKTIKVGQRNFQVAQPTQAVDIDDTYR